MDKVSGIAEKSNDFASFLNVPRKFKYNFFCKFHIIYLETLIWELIFSQTNIINIFLGSVWQCSWRKLERRIWLLKIAQRQKNTQVGEEDGIGIRILYRNRLREPFDIGEPVCVLAEWLKSKGTQQDLQNLERKKACWKRLQTDQEINYDLLSKEGGDDITNNRFIRQELFALRDQFI